MEIQHYYLTEDVISVARWTIQKFRNSILGITVEDFLYTRRNPRRPNPSPQQQSPLIVAEVVVYECVAILYYDYTTISHELAMYDPRWVDGMIHKEPD